MEASSVGDRRNKLDQMESSACLRKPDVAGADDASSLRFATSAGVFHFDPEAFIADVVNSVRIFLPSLNGDPPFVSEPSGSIVVTVW